MRPYNLLWAGIIFFTLSGCSGGGDYQDLDAYLAEKKVQPGGYISPIPPFMAYKAFSYSATGMRSPFSRPVEIQDIAQLKSGDNVKPDPSRAREFLEQFTFDSLTMVGTLTRDGSLWALVKDETGGIHRVRTGNYLGKNHGKVVATTEAYIAVIEIAPDGSDAWFERPRTIKLNTTE